MQVEVTMPVTQWRLSDSFFYPAANESRHSMDSPVLSSSTKEQSSCRQRNKHDPTSVSRKSLRSDGIHGDGSGKF